MERAWEFVEVTWDDFVSGNVTETTALRVSELGSVPDAAMEESVRDIGSDIVMPKDTLSEEVITRVALTVEHLHVG